MMNVLELRETVQDVLNDEGGATFTDALVDIWIREAIEEYSQHFGKVVTVAVSGIAEGTYAYTITERIGNIVQVEYPESEDPPQYLTRRASNSDEFWLHADSYDFIRTKGEESGILYLSDPTQDTTATITALRSFDETVGTVEVPAKHEPLLIMRCRWSARQFMADGEMLNPTSSSSLLMAQMEQNAKSARKNYFSLLYAAKANQSGKSKRVRWSMDKWDV